MIQFSIPKGTKMEKIRSIGESCIGAIAVFDLSKRNPAAIVKDYIVQDGFLLFILSTEDEHLISLMAEEDVSANYEFIDLVSCHFNPLH